MSWWIWAVLPLPILLNLWSIWHAWAHEFANPQERAIWFVVAVFVPVLGGLAYILVGRRRALAPGERD